MRTAWLQGVDRVSILESLTFLLTTASSFPSAISYLSEASTQRRNPAETGGSVSVFESWVWGGFSFPVHCLSASPSLLLQPSCIYKPTLGSQQGDGALSSLPPWTVIFFFFPLAPLWAWLSYLCGTSRSLLPSLPWSWSFLTAGLSRNLCYYVKEPLLLRGRGPVALSGAGGLWGFECISLPRRMCKLGSCSAAHLRDSRQQYWGDDVTG